MQKFVINLAFFAVVFGLGISTTILFNGHRTSTTKAVLQPSTGLPPTRSENRRPEYVPEACIEIGIKVPIVTFKSLSVKNGNSSDSRYYKSSDGAEVFWSRRIFDSEEAAAGAFDFDLSRSTKKLPITMNDADGNNVGVRTYVVFPDPPEPNRRAGVFEITGKTIDSYESSSLALDCALKQWLIRHPNKK